MASPSSSVASNPFDYLGTAIQLLDGTLDVNGQTFTQSVENLFKHVSLNGRCISKTIMDPILRAIMINKLFESYKSKVGQEVLCQSEFMWKLVAHDEAIQINRDVIASKISKLLVKNPKILWQPIVLCWLRDLCVTAGDF